MVNGIKYQSIKYYGGSPTINKSYPVFVPNGNMSNSFIITPSVSGGGGTGTTDYNQLDNRPSINSVLLSGNKTLTELGIYGAVNPPSYPVTSVNEKNGDIVLTQDDIGDGTTYVRTHNDFTDEQKSAILNNKTSIDSLELEMSNKYSATNPPPYPVSSVNGSTGDITLTQDNIGNGSVYVRTHNDFTNEEKNAILNNSTSINALQQGLADKYSADNPPPYPVLSVNGKTGSVVLSVDSSLSVTSENPVQNSVITSALDGLISKDAITQTIVDDGTKIPSSKAVNDALQGIGGGLSIVKSTEQPSGQKTGDFWYKII